MKRWLLREAGHDVRPVQVAREEHLPAAPPNHAAVEDAEGIQARNE